MRRILCALIACCLALPVAAQRYNPGENLVVDIPPGFVLAHRGDDPAVALEEFVPHDQDLLTWQELITLQVFEGQGGQDPAAFLGRLVDGFTGACPEGQAGEVNAVDAGPYPAALVIATCPDSPRTEGVESFVAYAIGGRVRLYVLQFAWARRPSEADFAEARAFLATALVCDTTRAEVPCPEEAE